MKPGSDDLRSQIKVIIKFSMCTKRYPSNISLYPANSQANLPANPFFLRKLVRETVCKHLEVERITRKTTDQWKQRKSFLNRVGLA